MFELIVGLGAILGGAFRLRQFWRAESLKVFDLPDGPRTWFFGPDWWLRGIRASAIILPFGLMLTFSGLAELVPGLRGQFELAGAGCFLAAVVLCLSLLLAGRPRRLVPPLLRDIHP